jgi:hypothetical protein
MAAHGSASARKVTSTAQERTLKPVARPDRREAIVRLGLAAAAVLVEKRLGRTAPAAAGAPEILGLSTRIRDASRDGAWEAAAGAIRAGASPRTLLGAVFLAGVEDIRPRPHGILHAVMMVESACQLSDAAAGAARAAWHPALFNLDDLKTAQESDRREWDDYRMRPLPAAAHASADAARREFVQAMESFDPERAERAAAALAVQVGAAEFFEALRPFTARCYAFIGHKAIYAAQVESALGRIGWAHAEPAVRSLVLALLVGRETAGYDRARDLARALPVSVPGAGRGDGRADDLLAALRAAAPAAAAEAVAAALRAGLGAETAWDAIVLLGAEVFQRRPGRRAADGGGALLPVHAVTVPGALRRSFTATGDEATRALLLLQAASWTARLRDDLGRLVGLSPGGQPLAAEGSGRATLDDALESASPGRALAYLEREPQGAAVLLARMRASLARRGREHHQHKLAAALAEEAARVHPSKRPLLLAPAVDYLANPADADTDVFRRAERALDAAGVA